MAFGDYLKKLGETLGSSEKKGLFTSVFNMAYGANQSRLAFERQQYLLNREHDLNEQSAEAAYQRELEADSTKHQREVADLQAAGLNPILATGMSGGSVNSSPASASASSAPPAAPGLDLGALLRGVQLDIERKIADSEVAVNVAREENIRADTEQKRAETEGQQLYNDFFKDTSNLRKILLSDEHERNQWERNIGERGVAVKEAAQKLAEDNAKHYNALLDKQRELIETEIGNNDLKRALLEANAREANCNAMYKAAMIEVDQEYKRAASKEAANSAELLAVEARLKNGVYTPDYIKSIGRAALAEADMKETLAAYERGDYSRASVGLRKMFLKLEKEGTLRGNYTMFQVTERGADAAGALPYR